MCVCAAAGERVGAGGCAEVHRAVSRRRASTSRSDERRGSAQRRACGLSRLYRRPFPFLLPPLFVGIDQG